MKKEKWKLDTKIIGSIIIVFSLLMAGGIWAYTSNINQLIEIQMGAEENCFVDGKCIHEEYKATEITIIASILITLMIVLGLVLLFQRKQEQEQITSELKGEVSAVHEFELVKKGLSEDEKKILAEIEKEKEITQDSLRFRLEWSKAKVSTILTHLDKMGIIQRRREGKTYVVFLSKKEYSERTKFS